MKIHGQKIQGPNIEIIAFPRPNTKDIIFKAQAVTNYDDFEKLCPRPTPPTKVYPGKKPIEDVADPQYNEELNDYGQKRTNYMILKSLSVTDGLEWETVDWSDPESWGNYKQELQDSGFSDIEMVRLINGVMAANGLDDDKIEQARERFLAESREKVEVG